MVKSKRFQKAIFETSFLFGLLVWLYVIAMQIAHPESVSWSFVYWSSIQMDFVGEVAFIIAIISFFLLRMQKN